MKFKLIKGEIEEFAIIEDKIPEDLDNIIVKCGIIAKINPNEKIIAIYNTVRFCIGIKDLLKIKSVLYFKIHADTWDSLIFEEEIILKKTQVQHFGIITIGATRGMLIAKTNNTPYSSMLLPPLNINDIINEDIKFLKNQ
ncbi:hypothetical protein [Sphingobacterium sp. MYb382]|uniref:hypothetical protein n=1 Tax=Sphingobacterium sp. MYb382 TaxID=2745278 RepID=UPI00309A92BA